MYITVMILNAVWFGAAFRFFGLQQGNAAKLLVPYTERGTAMFTSMAAIVRFLGGMNGALCLLSVAAVVSNLTDASAFTDEAERAILLLVLGVAHLSQFAFNLAVLRERRVDEMRLWPVLTGPMLTIFLVDLLLALTNLSAAVIVVR